MKVYRGIFRGAMLPLGVLLTIGVLIASADDKVKTVEVDCTKGKTIAKALERGNEEKPLVVVVQGICSENVVIDRDDVTLQGNSSGDGVTGLDPIKDTILIDGAHRVVIENLTLSGGRNGITFFQGSNGTVDNCTVQNNGGHGIRVEGGSATVINSTISGNTDVGILLTAGGNGRIGINTLNQYAGNTISTNGAHGIHITYGASALIGGNKITGNGTTPNHPLFDRSGISLFSATASIVGNNEITGNAGAGVSARSSSLRIGDGSLNLPTANSISGNGVPTSEGGVDAFIGTAVDIRNATINGNAGNGVSGSGSSVRIRDSTIHGNIGPTGITAFLGTSLDIRNTEVSGNTGIGVTLTTRSVGRIRESTILNNASDGIRIVFGSSISFVAPVNVTGNGGFGLQCGDPESSFVNFFAGGGNGSGDVSPACTGF
jgi:parallel beta-helix repeat protein